MLSLVSPALYELNQQNATSPWARLSLTAAVEAMARLTGAIIAASTAGCMETEIAAETGLNRGTVRKAKRPPPPCGGGGCFLIGPGCAGG